MMTVVTADVEQRLLDVLLTGQRLGHLGRETVQEHIRHARAHGAAAGITDDERWCDLGSGGGVPGLVLAVDLPRIKLVLLDRSERRAVFLRQAVLDLGLSGRVSIACGEAAELAHLPIHRGAYDGVVSRAFGHPAATAECACGLLRIGGRLVVSEPPGSSRSRWPSEPLSRLGLDFVRFVTGTPRFAVLVAESAAANTYPRAWKRIRKQPLF